MTKRKAKLRTWHVYHVNCDCASYEHAWQREPGSFRFHRCIFCHHQLGDMQLVYRGTCKALSCALACEVNFNGAEGLT